MISDHQLRILVDACLDLMQTDHGKALLRDYVTYVRERNMGLNNNILAIMIMSRATSLIPTSGAINEPQPKDTPSDI